MPGNSRFPPLWVAAAAIFALPAFATPQWGAIPLAVQQAVKELEIEELVELTVDLVLRAHRASQAREKAQRDRDQVQTRGRFRVLPGGAQ